MSLIFGIFDKNPHNVAPTLHQLYAGLRHLPHEKQQFLVQGTVGFGNALTYNTPEALYEQMPVYLPDEQLLFVAQGRIDNREALAQVLGIALHDQQADGDLILKAYLHWGEGSADKLLGDWSFAVYDFKNKTLFMARDKIGYTALFYYFDGQKLVFSSSQKSILNLPNFKKELNEDKFFAQLLIWDKSEERSYEQLYKGIFLLPPAHTLRFKDGKISTNRYWFPEKIQPQTGKTTQQYAAELNELLTEAVRCRLRSFKPVAALLSGGLDSGSVATIAAEIYRKEGKRLTTFSHVPLYRHELAQEQTNPQVKRTLDETDNIMATAQKATNIDTILLNSAHLSPSEGALKFADIHDGLFHAICNGYWLYDLPHQVQQQGFGTLLTGEMGNASISFTGVPYLLPLAHAALRNNLAFFLKQKIAKPLILKYAANNWYYKDNKRLGYVKNSYLNQQTLDRLGVIEDIRKSKKVFHKYYHTPAEGMLGILKVGYNSRCMLGANVSHYLGIEKRDPTSDIRVVEYCLSIPAEAWISDTGELKAILKTMMKNRLPDSVLFSTKKGLQSADIRQRLRAESVQIETMIEALKQNERANQYFDFEKMQRHWLVLKTEQKRGVSVQNIIKNLVFAQFLTSAAFPALGFEPC